jgi:hypothetical protein
LISDHPFRITVILLLLGISILHSSKASAVDSMEDLANEILDVNLNSLYLGSRSQPDFDTLTEVILQLPYPISETAKKTGQGPFGGITYFDYKTLSTTDTQLATVLGLGRIYYSTTVPGDTPTTFIPYLTWYRALFIDYKDPAGPTVERKINSWLSPGFMYTYRFNKKLAFHFDSELYSYTRTRNNRGRIGFSYLPKWPIIFTVSVERVSWDLDEDIGGNNFLMRGDNRDIRAKVIIRNPPNGNFSFFVGYGSLRSAAAQPIFQQGAINSVGRFIGVEASAGVLAW